MGGLSFGLLKTGNVYEGERSYLSKQHPLLTLMIATFYASVSASFIIEQSGLPSLSEPAADGSEKWNNDDPYRRVEELRVRHSRP